MPEDTITTPIPIESLAKRLRKNGHKLTCARRAVLQVLIDVPTPLSINDLHKTAQTHDPSIGLVTVYRTLELLEELALVRPVHLMDNCHGYALATPGHTHHVICRSCSRVIEVEGCDLSAFLEQLQEETGYKITEHWLEIAGLCPTCQTKQK